MRSIDRFVRLAAVVLVAPLFSIDAVAAEKAPAEKPAARPNILWITAEDHGPHLGCYGDQYTTTPNLDRLASRGMRFDRVWSNAPVCAPARTAIILGMHPIATGAHHMRSLVPAPAGKAPYPQLLREAGYYCTNHSKEDYNYPLGKPWDASSNQAHWKNRKPGQPFFAVVNLTLTHESQIRRRPYKPVHDPSKVPLPPYHPDHPEARLDWAQYHDRISQADSEVGKILAELESSGLTEETIVFYYADHGPGMPRCKRWPCDSGLRVPLIAYFPEKWRKLAGADYAPGKVSQRLVSFVDLAPTALSLAGVRPPEWMHGSAVFGEHAGEAPQFLFGYRGRMDERYDLVRSVTDGRYVYVRHFMPHLPFGQHLEYMFQTPTTQVWKELFDAGKLNEAQSHFWKPKPAEELFDLQSDPHEIRNLAGSADHAAIQEKLRTALEKKLTEIRDVGFLPESEMHRRAAGASPYDWARRENAYPFDKIFAAAKLATLPDAKNRAADLAAVAKLLDDSEPAVRYWGAIGLQIRGAEGVRAAEEQLLKRLADESPAVRVAAAESLGLFGSDEGAKKGAEALVALIRQSSDDSHVLVETLNAMERLGPRLKLAAGAAKAVGKLPESRKGWNARSSYGIPRLVPRVLKVLE